MQSAALLIKYSVSDYFLWILGILLEQFLVNVFGLFRPSQSSCITLKVAQVQPSENMKYMDY